MTTPLSALLHHARLDAVRRQAAVDSHPIGPWHLATLVEGLLFIADLAFGGPLLDAAKLGIFAGSLASAVGGLALLAWLGRLGTGPGGAAGPAAGAERTRTR